MRLISSFVLMVALFFAASIPSSVFAQTVGGQSSIEQSVAEQTTPIDPTSWTPLLDSATEKLEGEQVRERELDNITIDATKVREEATRQIDLLQPRLDELSQQISELGPEPAEGEPAELPEAKKSRDDLNEQFANVDAQIKEARLAVVRAQQLQKSVVQTRQEKFFRSISVRTKGIYTVDFWSDFIGGVPQYLDSTQRLFANGFKNISIELNRNSWKIALIAFLLLLVAYLFVRLRRLLKSKITFDNSDNLALIYQSRFLEFCSSGLLPAFTIFVVYQIFWQAFILTPDMGTFFAGLGVVVALYIMAVSMLRIVLLPREGRRRILLINDLPAKRIVNILTIGLGVAAIFAILNGIELIIVSRLSISVALSFFVAVSVAISFIASMWIVYKDRHYNDTLTSVVAYTRKWQVAKFLVQTSAIVIIVAALLGYIAFAEFFAQQLVFGVVVIGTVWLILRFVHNLTAPLTDPASVQKASSSDDSSAEGIQPNQFVILATGILTLVLYLVATVLLLLPWGYRTSDFYQVVENVFFGFEIGGLRISVSTVLLVIFLFLLGYMITVSLRNWLNNKLLPTTSFDVGVSNSISTVFGYIGFILAAVFAISVAGFDLSNLAIVAGALSVGVGFGLQSIVNNFVSGLILLAERPIKAGDWIVTSGGEGTVTKISVRSTEIETFDRATVIIPNSSLITDNVTNWTHENKTGRIIIPVGVGYESDVEQVKEILLQCAKEQRLVLGRPAPQAYFMDFGANSLDFQLRCFLADINYSLSVSSELRFSILKALREANVEIPFPQTDLHIRSGLENINKSKT